MNAQFAEKTQNEVQQAARRAPGGNQETAMQVMHYLPYLVIVLLSGVCIYLMHILS